MMQVARMPTRATTAAKSDQEDTTPQEDKAGGETCPEDMGSSGSDCSSSESEVQIKETREISLQKKKSSKDDSHTMLPELNSKATAEEQ